jgi:hypothetical protein
MFGENYSPDPNYLTHFLFFFISKAVNKPSRAELGQAHAQFISFTSRAKLTH